ncbi:hypothetical protein PsorP6_002376 [Peronosclerospora sorghi]|uniref:Uncharacterized protein n=1 Tax=Peronosclerospora sorghi TaxID=230839 RepID=A0ACC0WWA5_9STRA|nr:hypothetical protein PsorP6_002376 [Peronosclerospora sorghi]
MWCTVRLNWHQVMAMEKQAFALEGEVRQLCEQEQTKHTALLKQRLYSRVGQFLMGSLDMRHWWCGYSTLMVFMMRVLELYPTTESVCFFYKRMIQQLRTCRKCVDIYHASMASVHIELEFEFTPDSIKLFFIKLQGMDAHRIQRHLEETSMGASSEILVLTLYEILTQRRLLSDFRIIRVLSKWTSSQFSDVNTNPSLESLRGCAGLYLLMVSPDSAVREWAKKMVQHFGKIQLTVDDGKRHYMLDVLDEWMCILENQEFNKSLLLLDINTTKHLQDFLEPTNCVKTPTKPILWSALDHLIQQMDINSLEVMLDSFDTIPDVAFSYLQDADPTGDQTLTLMVSKCFAVLLRCLGHRFWNYSAYSAKAVVDVVMHHCRLGLWRMHVTKQFIELLPPLLVAIRPPQVTSRSSPDENHQKLDFYFKTRKEILQFLIVEDRRPKHYDAVATVATSRAAFTVLIDCYEHRTPGSARHTCKSGQDEGALSTSYFIDCTISESAFWWPCGSVRKDSSSELQEKQWMDHLFHIVVKPNNVESLVDLAAETTALILSKHLQLARDLVYSNLTAKDPAPIEAVTKRKPVITHLLRKLCVWETVATIPIQVHGALFESIGGISELLNSILDQRNPSELLQQITKSLRNYENYTKLYLQRMCDEVLLRSLNHPFGYPVVSQHLNACFLSSTKDVDEMVKRLVVHYAADKNRPNQIPSRVEAFLICVHRNTEAFLCGQLSMLQFMRLYGFSMSVCLPAVKKLICLWSKVFDMLSSDLEKLHTKAATAMTTVANQTTDTITAATRVLKLWNLINEFFISLMTSMFDPKAKITVKITEANRVHCLDFGILFWKFRMSVLKDPSLYSKHMATLVTPLVECVARGSVSEKKRGAELLMTVLRCLLKGNVCLDGATLSMIDSIKGEAASIESNQSTDFGAMTKKFRQLDQNSRFFMNRSAGVHTFMDMTSTSKSKLPAKIESSASSLNSTARETSGKLSAISQGYAFKGLTAAEELSNEAAARKHHSFYSEEEYHAASTRASSPIKQASKSKSSFSISQIIKGISHSHSGSSKTLNFKEMKMKQINGGNPDERKEEKEGKDAVDLRFAALFHRIKTTRSPVAVCSLLPFYRQLLQACMPVLLSGEFQEERSEKELQVPALNYKTHPDYVRAFLPLMLEECNNEVQEALRKIYDESRGHLLHYESEQSRESMRCIKFTIAQRDEKLLAASCEKLCGKKPGLHKKLFRNGDVVLLRISIRNKNQRDFMGKREFLGVILISETDKGRRQTSTTRKNAKEEDEEAVKVLFLNDGELDDVTANVRSFSSEVLAASAITDTEWKVSSLCNLVTSAREYVALRSVDMLPEHLRSAILTPEAYKSTQSKLISITSVLNDMRLKNFSDCESKIAKILKCLDKIDVVLNDLRSTSIGKVVNKLRKHKNVEIKTLSGKLIEKWTSLMDETDTLERAPRFLPPDLWEAMKPQYNSSQLQSIHNVLNNYSVGVSLLQGPPGTGKTKTIMGLLSGLLSLRLPATAVMPLASTNETKAQFDNFEAARSRTVSSTGQSTGQPSGRSTASTFSLKEVTSALGSILRRSSDSSGSAPSRTTIQSLKNLSTSRSRLENKLSARPTPQPHGNLVVKRRVISRAASELLARRTNNVLLCAPSNGAINELVLRIVTEGLLDSAGNVTAVRAPSMNLETHSDKGISIVRLGNAGEDASEAVNSVCLPHIIRREMAIHPKAMELHSLQETQRQLRNCIRNFHSSAKDVNEPKKDRKALAKMHQQLTGCTGKIRRLRDEVTAIRAKMTDTLLSKASIIACTLSKAGSGDLWGLKHGFDALIIDEAAQAVELSTLVPIRERVARVILVGDPKQLPATVKSVVAAKARYDRSLFERIAESGVAPSMLRVQYRMHPFLREFPSKRFYGGMLTDGPNLMERVQKVGPGIYAHTCFQPFLVYDVDSSREEDMNGSKYNRVEAAFCVSLCQHMFETCAEVRTNKWSVGFVSPYKEQVRIIRQEVTRLKIPTSVSIEVNTVDGFQGREKDVIVFSCVRSSQRGGIGFLRDIRRLNVAITRARFCLYVVGNVNTLMRDETWAALIRSAQDRKLVIRTDGDEFPRVMQRLKGDRYRHLAEHFKTMHEKAVTFTLKATRLSAQRLPANSKSGPVLPEERSVKTSETTNSSNATRRDNQEANSNKITGSGSISLNLDKRQSQVEAMLNSNDPSKRPVEGLKRFAKEALNVPSAKKSRTSVVTALADVESRTQSNLSAIDSRQHSENQFLRKLPTGN